MEVVSKLIEVGGRELVMEKGQAGRTALHIACSSGASVEVVSKIIEIAGTDILLQTDNNGHYALYDFFFQDDIFDETFTFVVKEYISAQIGGEFAIGGLFNNASDSLRNQIFDKWEKFSTSLATAISSLQTLPCILHAAIIAKAPPHIIADIIDCYDCISIRDSFNSLPISLAKERGLEWSEGMREVIEATSAKRQCPIIHVAAEHGLPWSDYMRELIESNTAEVVDGVDNMSGLRVFMLAAVGKNSDLSTIYGMMKMSPSFARCDE